MPRRKNLPLIIFIVLILALVPTFFTTHPAAAQVDLKAGKGEAVWLFRSCQSGKPGAVANWVVDLNPSAPSRTSLNIKVKNVYPNYQLICDLYFANSGKLPILVKTITVTNLNSGNLILSATVPADEQKKIIQPCNSKPSWGKNPASLSPKCWSKIKLILTVGPKVKENISLNFAIQVRLEEKSDYHDH